jgi:ribonuclease BN (tRNA processing enzyme)
MSDMKLIVLGSGTCVPSLKRNAPGYFLETENKQIIIDCGSGTLLQLERCQRSYKDIDAVFITHTHPDHLSDLIPLIQALIATPSYKRENDLFISGPRGLKDFFYKCFAYLLKMPKSFKIELTEIKDRVDLDAIHILSTKTVHSEDSIAYRFEERGKSIVITGDCDYDQGIIGLSRDADLLIIECSFPNALKTPGHLTPRECGRVAKYASVKKLLLSHIYPVEYSDKVFLEECKAEFDGDVSLAEDLMVVSIS